jgi:hypothetical protein
MPVAGYDASALYPALRVIFDLRHGAEIRRTERHGVIRHERTKRGTLRRRAIARQPVAGDLRNCGNICLARDEHFRQHRRDGDRIEEVRLRQLCVVEISPEPTRAFEAIRRGGLPNFRRTEVRMIRRRIARALHDRDLAGVVHRLQRFHRGIEPDLAVDLQDVAGRDAERRTIAVILLHAVRHDRIEAVVPALQVDDHEHAVVDISAG